MGSPKLQKDPYFHDKFGDGDPYIHGKYGDGVPIFTGSPNSEGSATGRNIVHYGRNFKKYDRSMERSIGISANLGVKGISANLGVKGISGNFLGIHRSSEKHKGVQRE